MNLFKPRHTFESVVRELVEGLESGTIVLDRPLETDSARKSNHLAVMTELERSRRRLRWLLVANVLGMVPVAVSVILAAAWTAGPGRIYWALAFGMGLGLVMGCLNGYALARYQRWLDAMEEAEKRFASGKGHTPEREEPHDLQERVNRLEKILERMASTPRGETG
jgi:hypothetical protein